MGTWQKWLLFLFKKKKSVEEEEINFNATDELSLFPKKYPIHSEFIQSYLLAASKHHFSEQEKRVLYRLVECFQLNREGKHKDFLIKKNSNGYVEIALSFEEKADFPQMRKALDDLQKRTVQYEDEDKWISIPFINCPEVDKNRNTAQLWIHGKIYEALLNLPKNYQKQELEAVMSFRSIYATRFHELLKGQNGSVTHSMDELRKQLGVEDKYRKMNNFLTRVMEQARKELDQKGTVSFIYQLEYGKDSSHTKVGKKRVTGITITPLYRPEQQVESEEQDSMRNILKGMFGFSGEMLEKLTEHVLKEGGNTYLNRLLRSCKGNTEKVKEKLIAKQSDTDKFFK